MQPFFEVSVTRPWHWGIAIVSAIGAPVPEQLSESVATATPRCLVLKVRHAQDIEAKVFDGDWEWATATIRVRSLPELTVETGTVLYEGSLVLPDGRLSIGDADGSVVVEDLPTQCRVRVVADEHRAETLGALSIDLAP